MNNLVIQTAFLGDLILSVPLMRMLVQIDPDHPLTVVCRKGFGDAIRFANVANELIEVDKSDKNAWREQKRGLLDREFHHIVCPHESPRSAGLVWQLKAKGEKVGFEKIWNGFAFSRRVKRPDHLPDALRQLSLLVALNSDFAEDFSIAAQRDEVLNSTNNKTSVDFRSQFIPHWADLRGSMGIEVPDLKKRPRRILLAPGSVWNTKQWTIEGYIEVASELTKANFEVWIVGSRSEAPLGELIRSKVYGVKNFAGEWTLNQTMTEMKSARAIVANDSGAIHMAALAGLPTVAIFGPTTLSLGFRPWQRQAIVVQRDLACRPCGKHGHKKCPIGTHDCMKGLSAKSVLDALFKFEA